MYFSYIRLVSNIFWIYPYRFQYTTVRIRNTFDMNRSSIINFIQREVNRGTSLHDDFSIQKRVRNINYMAFFFAFILIPTHSCINIFDKQWEQLWISILAMLITFFIHRLNVTKRNAWAVFLAFVATCFMSTLLLFTQQSFSPAPILYLIMCAGSFILVEKKWLRYSVALFAIGAFVWSNYYQLINHPILDRDYFMMIPHLLLFFFVLYHIDAEHSQYQTEITRQKNEIKQQQEELQVFAEELQTTNEKLELLGQFKESMMASIVHDLKNPLGIILNSPSADDTTHKMASRMLNLVNNILDIQKFENADIVLKLQEQSMHQTIEHAIKQVTPFVSEKNITIQAEIGVGLSCIYDTDLIERVFVNLLTNAVKFSPNNGLIRVEAWLEDDHVLINIRDNGSGIPQSLLPKIFDRYQQATAKAYAGIQSTGIGLTFCKMIVEAHHGKINVESKEGEGASFIIQLPQGFIQSNEINMPASESKTEQSLLSSSDLLLLKPVCEELAQLEIYQFSRIKKLISQLGGQSDEISYWAKEVENACLNSNEQKYNELVLQVLKK